MTLKSTLFYISLLTEERLRRKLECLPARIHGHWSLKHAGWCHTLILGKTQKTSSQTSVGYTLHQSLQDKKKKRYPLVAYTISVPLVTLYNKLPFIKGTIFEMCCRTIML